VDDDLRSTLLYRGGAKESPAQALARHLRRGETYDAALAARAMGDLVQAAELFERVRRFAEASACWLEAKEYRRCIRCTGQVPPDHALYPSCARLAVEAAVQLNEVNAQVANVLAPWRKKGPRDTCDEEVFRELGDLYARLGRVAEARAVYDQIAKGANLGASQGLRVLNPHEPESGRPEARAPSPSPARNAPLPSASSRGLPPVTPPRGAAASASSRGLPPAAPPPPPSLGSQLAPRLSEPPPAVGSLLAQRYRLEQLLGAGATATVYMAHDLALDQPVAIKLFAGALDDEAKARFRREISLARKLAHDHIVRIFDLVLAPNTQGLTMELVEGVTLNEHMKRAPLSLHARRDLLLQAVSAFDYAHRHGVVHRDIKPENMLVTKAGTLKVTDFGIAKACEEATITQTGAFGGTPYYVAPEQITNFREVDHRADIYSLGVVAYELFVGRPPFEGETVIELLMQHANTPPPAPRSFAPALPASLDALLLKLLQKNPADRIQSCRELEVQLGAIDLVG